MYPVSAAFKTQMKKSHRIEHVRGTIAGVSFDDDNIVSLNYSNRCSDTSDVTFGSAYIGQISAVFTGLNIQWGGFRGQLVVLEYGLEFDDHSIEWIPIGTFKIQKAEWTDISISIVASDIIADLDKVFSVDTTSGEFYDLFMLGCDLAGVSFARTRQQIEALPNGDELFGLYPQNDIKTIRDYCSWLAQLIGGYVTADRSGDVTIRSFSESSQVDQLTAQDRIIGSVFSDYSTYYDGISYVDLATNATRYRSAGTGDGSVINLGSNPFLQYGTDQTLLRQSMAIAEVANDIKYTPFAIAVLNNPVYDLGDVVRCTGGVAGSERLDCCIMGIDWSFKQTTQLQGFGEDPSLSTARSKTDKALSGILSQTSKDELTSYTFTNAGEILLPEDEEVSILTIRFGTVSPKTIDFWAELVLDTEYETDPELISAKVLYYLDDELLTDYYPETSWNNEGLHLMHLLKYLETLEGGKSYKFEVRMIMTNGSAMIAAQNIHAKLSGQGLASEGDSGYIEVSDDYILNIVGQIGFSYSDSIELTWTDDSDDEDISENYSLNIISDIAFGYTDSVYLNIISPIYTRITDSEDIRITDDDDVRITDGDPEE